jgi:hypothetical protein
MTLGLEHRIGRTAAVAAAALALAGVATLFGVLGAVRRRVGHTDREADSPDGPPPPVAWPV